MFNGKLSLFSHTQPLENKIDLFHDKLLDAAMTFKKAIRIYLKEKRSEEYKKINKQIKQIEHDADNLRRAIEAKLYTQNLIPDLRADVLNLVENLDKVINKFDEVVYVFGVMHDLHAVQTIIVFEGLVADGAGGDQQFYAR